MYRRKMTPRQKEIFKKAVKKAFGDNIKGFSLDIPFEAIIYNHGFAKGFWRNVPDIWRFHLQKMVLSEDPLEYLATFME